MAALTYVELFAGAGGLSLGLEAAGFEPVAHCEIEPHARAVLRYRWPQVRLDGDVSHVNGADFQGVTLVSGGSPCQDLSVAGKRAGLAGARSGLFHQQVRIWQESGAPYLLWENVLGALSSNAGQDFAAVLSAIVGTTIAVPSDGWRSGGVAGGPDAVAAWRVLDLQHFGPPQRRVRVFIVAARAGGVDPAEVLALSEGVCGHPSPRQQARESLAASTGGGAKGGHCVGAFQNTGQGWWNESDVAQTLRTPSGGDSTLANVLAVESTCGSNGVVTIGLDGEKNAHIEMMGTLNIGSKSGSGQQPAVMAFHHTQTPISGDVSPTLGQTTNGMGVAVTPTVVAFAENQRGELRTSEVMAQLTTGGGKPGEGYPAVVCTTGDITHALTHEGADASEDGTGRGSPIVVQTLTVGGRDKGAGDSYDNTPVVVQEVFTKQQYGAYTDAAEVCSTIGARDHAATNVDIAVVCSRGGFGEWTEAPAISALCARDSKDQSSIVALANRPRRLMPIECERLMSWPDHWTATGIKEDGTEYQLADTARYRLCGNGVGSVCVAWFAQRLADLINAQ